MNATKPKKRIQLAIQIFFIILCFALFARFGVKYDTGTGYREVILTLLGTTFLLLVFLKRQKMCLEIYLLFISGLLVIASFLLSNVKSYGIAEIFGFFAFINTIFVISQFKEKKLKVLTWGLLFLAIIAGLYGLYNFTHQPDPRVISNFINPFDPIQGFPNALALFLLIMWPYAAAKMINSKSKFGQISGVLILGILISTIYLTYSRGALIAFIIQLVILGFLNHKYIAKNILKWSTAGIITIILITGALAARAHNDQKISNIVKKITFENQESITSIDERMHFFKNTAGLIMENPLLGFGPQTFRFIYPSKQKLIYSNSDHPHNIFLKYSFESGLIFSFLLLFIFLSIILKNLDSNNIKNKQKDFVLVAFLGAIAHSMIDYNFNFLLNYIVFGITIGILLNFINQRKNQKSKSYYGEIFFISLLIISIILSIIGTRDYFRTDPYSNFETIKRYTHEELKTHITKYSQSLYPREFWIELSDYYFVKSDFHTALEMIEKHIRYNPHDKYGFLNKGKILFQLNKFDKAKEAFKNALEIDSNNLIAVHYHFLKTHIQTGQIPSGDYLKNTLYPLLEDFIYYAEHNLHHVAQKNEMEYAKCTIELVKYFDDEKDWDSFQSDLEDYAYEYREDGLKEEAVCD